MRHERNFLRVWFSLLFALPAELAAANPPTCCVWRITNVPAPFYLVGTVHALSGKDYPLPKPYEQAVRDSSKILFEMAPNPKSDFSKKFAAASVYPKDDDIRRHVHAETWAFLAKNFRISNYLGKDFWIGQHEQYVERIEKLRPWAIVYFIWGIRGYNDVFSFHGVDHHLAYQAKRFHKQVGGLETVDEHVEVLRGMSDMDSEIMLLDALVRGDKRRDDYNRLRAAWKRGDVEALAAEEARFRNLNLGGSMRLLDYRNVRWIPRIEAEIKSGQPTAIVAGTNHFAGPNNVRELLEKRGYKIEQL